MIEPPMIPAADHPSRFWTELGAEHARQLEVHGVDTIKRRQALRYFTWRWRPRAMLRSEQLRFLVRNTPPRTWADVLREPMSLQDELWDGSGFERGERRMTVIATRLVWAYAERHGSPEVLRLPEPQLGAPLPITFRERLISQDLANCALETRAIERALGECSPTSIVEIGGGYGRTAYALLSRYPRANYTIIDIEPARAISRWYLSQLFPEDRLRFLAPNEVEALEPASFDLAVSISSLQEMTPEQVELYLRLLDRTAAGGTVFLKQWETWRNPDDDLEMRFREYPVPGRWQCVLNERAPVQIRFVQAAWHVP